MSTTPIPTGDHMIVMDGCTDQVVGDILSGWRYDISGVSPEMRVDYERHLASCAHCRSKQRLHRTIDVTLLVISSLSVLVFLLATAVIYRAHMGGFPLAGIRLKNISIAVTAQMASVGGLLFSVLMWVLVAIATPAPRLISGTVRHVRERNL